MQWLKQKVTIGIVMMTGSALAIPQRLKCAGHYQCLVWRTGIGTAIADVLFSDYDPAGRLPITFTGRIQTCLLSVIML